MLDSDARETGFDNASHVSPALVLLQHATSCQYLHNRIQLSISMTKVGGTARPKVLLGKTWCQLGTMHHVKAPEEHATDKFAPAQARRLTDKTNL